MLDIFSGSVKMQKHSARLFLQVIDGSKWIFPFIWWAVKLHCFQLGVRERLSCILLGGKGFILGWMRCSLVSASSAHRCGF